MALRLSSAVLGLLVLANASNAAPPATTDPDLGALDLQSAPVEATPVTAPNTRILVEGALGSIDRRFDDDSAVLRRLSLDLLYSGRLAPNWRAVLSDRFDHLRPPDSGTHDTLNSLREAYLGWDATDGNRVLEFGRINLRLGPAYGFNPTDFFRDGALRDYTTVNPFALREDRLGTVMLRGQQLWKDGSVSLAVAPKLATSPSGDGFDLDFGATNNRSRMLLMSSLKVSDRVSIQTLLYKQDGQQAQPGASVSALIGDATVAYGEWSHSRESSLADRSAGVLNRLQSGNRFSGGVTYTTASKLSLTAEWQYSAFAADRSEWNTLSQASLQAAGAYLSEAQRLQDLPSRRALLLYAFQKNFGVQDMDLTAFLSINPDDHGRLGWLELRYHLSRTDLALQLQAYSGDRQSQYGINPNRSVVQLLASYHFQ